MEVYIEVVIFNNFIMTFLISLSTYKIIRADFFNTKKTLIFKALFVSFLGTIFCLIEPFINIGFYILFYKILLGILLGLILAYKSKKKLLIIIVFFVITFVYGGVMIGINYLTYKNTMALDMPLKIPFTLIMSCAAITYLLINKIFKKFYKIKILPHINKVDFKLFDKYYNLNAFIDNGNFLYYRGRPVIVVNINKIKQELGEDNYLKIKSGLLPEIKYIKYCTASNSSAQLLVINSPKIFIHEENKILELNNIPIGFTFENSNFEMLIHPAIIN